MKKITSFLLSVLLSTTAPVQATPTSLADWTETFECKGGFTITHKPDSISWKAPKGETITTKTPSCDFWFNPATHTSLLKPLKLHIEATRDAFKAALIESGLMDPDPVPVVAVPTPATTSTATSDVK